MYVGYAPEGGVCVPEDVEDVVDAPIGCVAICDVGDMEGPLG